MRDVMVTEAGEAVIESQYICSVCDLTETKLSTFAQYWQQLADDLTLKVGLRYENFEIEVPDYQRYRKGVITEKQGDTLKYNEPLVNLGAVYSVTDSSDLFASFSQGYSHGDMRMLRDMPVDTVTEFAGKIPATQSNYFETGLRFSDTNLQASFAIFYSDISDSYSYYESPYDGYTLVDLIASFNTDFGCITLGVDNLLYEDYQPLVSQMNKEVV